MVRILRCSSCAPITFVIDNSTNWTKIPPLFYNTNHSFRYYFQFSTIWTDILFATSHLYDNHIIIIRRYFETDIIHTTKRYKFPSNIYLLVSLHWKFKNLRRSCIFQTHLWESANVPFVIKKCNTFRNLFFPKNNSRKKLITFPSSNDSNNNDRCHP